MKLFVSIILVFTLVASNTEYYQTVIDQITKAVKTPTSPFYHSSFNRLAYIVDTFGPRVWGSPAQQLAIDELYNQLQEIGFDKVYKDPLDPFMTWRRGNESLTLYSPRQIPQKLKLIGLGLSPPGDIRGQVIVIKDFEELEKNKDQIKGKIVCFNQNWVNYGVSGAFRTQGPTKAAKFGAIAVLVRSVASFSIYSPHTGVTIYDEQFPKIPAAAITVEDAEMFQRMQDRGQLIEVHLHLESEWYKSTSDNLIAEIRGSQFPEEILLFGGHIDSWDTGSQTGANDDGGGFMICLEALRLIKELGLKPKRTIRFIAWSGEEMGRSDNGAQQYAAHHRNENHIIAFESDGGTTKLEGFGFTGNNEATTIVRGLISQYLPALKFKENSGGMADTEPLGEQGIPLLKNLVKDTDSHDFYFTYHHSAGDSMTMMNPDDLDDNVVGLASLFFLIADSEQSLPKYQ